MTSSKAASLKGRLGFAEGQLFGRAIRRLINELGHHAMHTPTRGTLGDGTRRALEMVADRIVKAGPGRVEATTSDVSFLFTDASFDCEARSGGLGAVLLNKCGHVIQWFGCIVPQDLCDSFMAENQEQAIGELEALASDWRIRSSSRAGGLSPVETSP